MELELTLFLIGALTVVCVFAYGIAKTDPSPRRPGR
jgi:hypothetical protein